MVRCCQAIKTKQGTTGIGRGTYSETVYHPKKELMAEGSTNKTLLAQTLGVARSSLYYRSVKEDQDWLLKTQIERTLRGHPGYGSRRVATSLGRNRKAVQRVMRKFGIKPYRRTAKKRLRKPQTSRYYPNQLLTTAPGYPHHIWAADFTEIAWHHKVYLATVLDLYTRQVVGVAVATRKGLVLTMQAICGALLHHPRPHIFHSDNGREYDAQSFTGLLTNLNVVISRSKPGCPWENGYQESFYGKFKLELGDPKRFSTLGELVAAMYHHIWVYNHTRIHSALNMPPKVFEKQPVMAA